MNTTTHNVQLVGTCTYVWLFKRNCRFGNCANVYAYFVLKNVKLGCISLRMCIPKCFILCVVCGWQVDEDMTAKLDLCHTRFSFMENELVYVPNWMAPEGLLPLLTVQQSV